MPKNKGTADIERNSVTVGLFSIGIQLYYVCGYKNSGNGHAGTAENSGAVSRCGYWTSALNERTSVFA